MKLVVGILELLIAIYLTVSIFVPAIRPSVGRGLKNMRPAGPAFCVLAAVVIFAAGILTLVATPITQ